MPAGKYFTERRCALLIAAAAVILLAAAVVSGVNGSEEELDAAPMTTMLQAKAVLRGGLPLWSSSLGFGVPLPGAITFFMHPLMPLFAWCDVYVAVLALYVVHIVIGAASFWYLCSTLGLSRITRGVCTATFLLSSPSLCYTLSQFVPSQFVAWTLAPLALGLLIDLLGGSTHPGRTAIALGLVVGLALADGHFGHAPFLIGPLAAGSVACPRRLRSRWIWLALAAAIACTIAAHHLGIVFDEYRRFDHTLPRWTDEVLEPTQLVEVFLKPNSTRGLFFGGPFAVLSIVCLFRRDCRHPFRGMLAAGAGLSVILLIVSARQQLFALSATYLLRDAAIIPGIALAGLALDRADVIKSSPARRRAIVMLQLVVMFLVGARLGTVNIAGAVLFHTRNGETAAQALADRLRQLAESEWGRTYMTPEAYQLVPYGPQTGDVAWRVRTTQSGVARINGVFKGIFTGPIEPAQVLPYGPVMGDRAFSTSRAALTVLGLRYIVSLADEPVADGLERVADYDTPAGRVHVLSNAGAWPGARFVDVAVLGHELPLLPGCAHTRLLCRDLAPLLAAADGPPPVVQYGDGEIAVTFPPQMRERTLFVTEMFREGWKGLAGNQPVKVTPAFGALMRVDVPAGARGIRLRYRPTGMIVLAGVSWLTAIIATIAWGWVLFRGTARAVDVPEAARS